ncbi:MAG: MATE family efflux transporter [Eubacteriales bacterium]|nr:MATE family efflux transporter [Eubacteriales bacterium]MDY3332617.1 MATE family efflux transporter [Gallibacter sp.]
MENKMGTMKISKLLMTMSGPAIASMFINSLYNIVDSIFVSYVGEKALAAVSIAYPIQMFMIAMGIGTGVGINSLIARRLGAKRFDDANKAASSGIKLAFFNWIVFLIIGFFFVEKFINVFTDDPLLRTYGIEYLSVVCYGCVFMMVSVLLEKIFQSTGNMIYPMIIMTVGAIVNVLLDPVLIFGMFGMPKLDVAGAALATVISQAIAMIVGLILLYTKGSAVKVEIFSKIDWKSIKEIYAVGFPTIIMQSLISVLMFGINAILAAFSTTAVAIMGVYGKLQSFVFMPVFGVNQGALPIMGYNYGARNKSRMFGTYKLATVIGVGIMAIGFLIFQFMPDVLLNLFNASPEMLEQGETALSIISFCFIPAGFSIIVTGLFQATGHGFFGLWGSMIRQFVLILPIAYFGGKMFGINAVWAAFPIAEIGGLIYFMCAFRYIYNTTYKHLEDRKEV